MTALSRPYPERIAELERDLRGALIDLATTRQQYHDADHGSRIWYAECRRLRSEASELMAENADHERLIADLRQRLDWHTQNAERQAERIRELEAEVERLRAQRLAAKLDLSDADADEWVARYRGEYPPGQHDLPPTPWPHSPTRWKA